LLWSRAQGSGCDTKGIEKMKLLTWLDVSGCDLDCFPKRMGQLEKLFELMLKDKKRLVNPPECIKKMKSLIMVDIGGCELDYLPKGVG
jgi:hypothetical protein